MREEGKNEKEIQQRKIQEKINGLSYHITSPPLKINRRGLQKGKEGQKKGLSEYPRSLRRLLPHQIHLVPLFIVDL
jgi:hypothetical protein